MFTLYTMIFIILVISMTVMYLASILSKKSMNDLEKTSPFECGFDPMNSSRSPFSIQFFFN